MYVNHYSPCQRKSSSWHFDKDHHVTRISVNLDLCINFGQSQPPTWCTLPAKLHEYVGWWISNTNIQSRGCCVVAFVFVFWCFCPHKCTPLTIFGQGVCPNVLKCQFCMSWPSDPKKSLVPFSYSCKQFLSIMQCLNLNSRVLTTPSIIQLDVDLLLHSTY